MRPSALRSALCLTLLVALAPARRAVAQPPFERQFDAALLHTQALLSQQFSRALPTPAPSSGVRYSFDPATATFTRDAAVLGQVYVDRAATLGAGAWNVRLMYQRAALDRLGGQDATDLPGGLLIRPIAGRAAAIRLNDAHVDVVSHQISLAGTYGVTDDLDVSLVLPMVDTETSADFSAEARAITTAQQLVVRKVSSRDRGNVFGMGDLQIYAKHRLPSLFGLDTAATLGVRFPTGNVDDLHGGGVYDVTPGVALSTPIATMASWARLQGHLNAGVDFLADDVGASEPRWAIGLDWGLTDGVTLGASFLARHVLRRFAPAGSFDTLRCGPDFVACLTDPGSGRPNAPIYGLNTGRPDYYDFAVGGRVSLWRDMIIGFASVVVPLNDVGVRTDPIPLIGVEASF